MSFIKFIVSKQFIMQLVIVAVIVVGGFFALSNWLFVTTNHDQKIQVPDLSKMEFSKVETVLKELNLRYEVIDSASFNPNYPGKSVIEQSPTEGEFVKENRKIYLTLNPSKYGDVHIVDFYGKTKNEVEAQLRAVGFVIGDYSYIQDLGKDVVRKLKFKGKEINKGDKLPKKSVIDLVLGNGKR
ncbi:PASTA domain-containing protein [Flavicella sediminum]|uniref:PASTA domain-containing protein n=1 Tax=Flavicella sediminum TaxID=2585141 RepID=UPI00111D8DAE|nr:PASTA domain-containing protein [Flavicella sediminum]